MSEPSRYRLFVLHAQTDDDWVTGVLLPRLGLSAAEILTLRSLTPGQSLLGELERAITSSELTLSVITHSFLAQPVAQEAERFAAYLAYLERQSRLVTLRLDDAEIPAYLRSRVGLDGRDPARLPGELERLARVLGQAPPPPAVLECPYPGIVPFTHAEAHRFFGRASEVQALVDRLDAGARLILVIGPSGSGKSSLLSAGLIPRLDPGRWAIHEMRPAAVAAFDLAGALEKAPADARLLWSIDQLEEAFTNPGLREPLFATLQKARKDPRVSIVLALRADFFGDLMGSPLWPVTPEQRVEVGPLAGERLREAIGRPAQDVGVIVASALLERLLADARNQPGALPFLQETLRSLWRTAISRGDRLLSAADYAALSEGERSGLDLAVARKADAALAALPSDPRFDAQRQRSIAQRTLIRLIHFGPPRTRRQLRWEDVGSAGDDPEELDATIRYLADHRLITTGEGRVVDLSHEALLTGWTTLRDWAAAAEQAEQVRRYYESAAENWQRLGKGEDGRLYSGELAEIDRWRSSEIGRQLAVTPLLDRLIAYSRRRLEEEQTAELAEERRRARHREILLRSLGTALFIALIALGGAWWLNRQLRREQELTYVQRLLDRSQIFVKENHESDELAALYARQAYLLNRELGGPHEGQAYEAMRRIVYDRAFVRNLPQVPGRGMSYEGILAISPNGVWAAELDVDMSEQELPEHPELVWWNLREKANPAYLTLDLSYDEHLVEIADNGIAVILAPPCTVQLVDLARRHAHPPVALGPQACTALALSPSGSEIALGGAGGVRRLLTTDLTTSLPSPAEKDVIALRYFPDGSKLAVASQLSVRIWPLSDPAVPVTLPGVSTTPYGDLLISPNGETVGFLGRATYVWSLKSRAPALLSHYDRTDDKTKLYAFDTAGRQVVLRDDRARRGDAGVDLQWLGVVDGFASSARDTAVFERGADVALLVFPRRKVWMPDRDYRRLALASLDGRRNVLLETSASEVVRWDLEDAFREPQVIGQHIDSLCSGGPGGAWVLSKADGRSRLMRIDADGQEVERVDLDLPYVDECAAGVGNVLVVLTHQPGRRSETHVLKVEHRRVQELLPRPQPCGGVSALSPDGKRFACTKPDGSGILWWQLGSGESPRTLPFVAYRTMAFSPDGYWLAAAQDKSIHVTLIDKPGVADETLRGPTEEVTALAFSPDGSALASASFDDIIRIWPRHAPRGLPWSITAVDTEDLAFLDAEHLLVQSSAGVEVLDLGAGRMADRICELVARNLTDEEWKTVLPDRPRQATCPGLPLLSPP